MITWIFPLCSYTYKLCAPQSSLSIMSIKQIDLYLFSEPSLKFLLRNQTYLNNSTVAINDIGEGDNALLCVTDKPDCCKPPNGTIVQGEFYYPNNSSVRTRAGGDSLYRNRGPQVVRLNRRNNVLSPTGIYRCEIPDSSGRIRNIYINVTGIDYTCSVFTTINSMSTCTGENSLSLSSRCIYFTLIPDFKTIRHKVRRGDSFT